MVGDTVDTVASPVTLTAVLTISSKRSTPRISAIPSTGSPACVNTSDSIIKPALGTAAVPMSQRGGEHNHQKLAAGQVNTVHLRDEYGGNTLHDSGAIHIDGRA